jgi:thiol:disulfide interchange protein DsbA
MRNLIISAALRRCQPVRHDRPGRRSPCRPLRRTGNPVPVAVPGKIEVVELFWYGCPHCYAFEPVINPWVEKLPSDVNFVRIPAMFGGPWDAHGQMFLTLEAMGVEHKVHAAVFEAIQKEHKKLTDKNDMADFLATQA